MEERMPAPAGHRARALPLLAAQLIAAMIAASPANAGQEAPKVVTDIAPIHSLAAMVMEGVGTPELLLDKAISPHDFSMRPTQARQLSQADLVFWVGSELTPGLERAIGNLSGQASSVALTGLFDDGEGHGDHDAEPEGHDEHAAEHKDPEHNDPEHHGDEAHRDHDEAEHGAHDDDHADGDHHDHEGDPHIWLDPLNALIVIDRMAEELTSRDPARAETYRANAKAARDRIESLTERLRVTLGPIRGRPYIVQHDAYRRFEARFGIAALAAISPSDGTAPSAAAFRHTIEEARASDQTRLCFFTEPQIRDSKAEAFAAELQARLGELDPLGSRLEPGPALYPALIEGLAESLLACLS